MERYARLEADVFSVFSSNAWKLENIKTYPNNFVAVSTGSEFLRISVIPSGQSLNRSSASGIVIVDIFTQAGNGPHRTSLLADKLDSYLLCKSLSTAENGVTQFNISSLSFVGIDKENNSLYRATYTIPFNYYGVL